MIDEEFLEVVPEEVPEESVNEESSEEVPEEVPEESSEEETEDIAAGETSEDINEVGDNSEIQQNELSFESLVDYSDSLADIQNSLYLNNALLVAVILLIGLLMGLRRL